MTQAGFELGAIIPVSASDIAGMCLESLLIPLPVLLALLSCLSTELSGEQVRPWHSSPKLLWLSSTR